MERCSFRSKREILLTQTKSLDNGAVAFDVLVLQVGEQSATLTYEVNKCSVRAIIFVIGLHVFGQTANTVGEQGNLAFATASIRVGLSVLAKDFLLLR